MLQERLIDGTGRVAAYSETLVWVGTQYFGGLRRDFGSLGIFIVVGVKPLDRTKLWCETVGGDLPSDVWTTFVDLLEGAGPDVRPHVTAPFAFALEAVLGAGPATGFPEGPKAWVQAAQSATEPIDIPDGLFSKVFPD
ncbi:MAG TPA: hypothetical protein VI341_11840 [Actinomycetota bacterium]